MSADDRLRKDARARVEATSGHLRRVLVKVEAVREARDVAIVRANLAGLSLQEVANASGMSRSNVAKLVRAAAIERGEIEG